MALTLAGCSGSDYDTSGAWFSKPLDLFGRRGGYTFSQLGGSKQERAITANDLVDANGACPAATPPAQPQSAAGNPGESSPAAAEGVVLGGVAVGMSECDVVARVGRPTAVNLGTSPSGDRTAILTFTSGPRPGVYRFIAGRLTEMDRVEEPAPAPEKNKAAKTKRTKKPQETRGDT